MKSHKPLVIAILLSAALLVTSSLPGRPLAGLTGSGGTALAADLSVIVRLTVERVRALDCVDETLGIACGSGADFYAVVQIDDQEFDNKPANDLFEDQDDITPNWEFSKPINVARGSIPL